MERAKLGCRVLGRTVGVACVLAASAWDLSGQVVRRDPVAYAGGAFVTANPNGELAGYFDHGFGAQLYGAVPLEASGRLRLRGDLGFVVYGYERQRVCFGAPVGCRIEADLTTTNNIFYGGLGPELVLATGALEPYANVSWGFSYFATRSSLGGSADWGDFAHTTNYEDATFAWRAGGGMRLRVKTGRVPVSVDLGVEYHHNGVASFLTEGDITDHADGSITMTPHRAEANLTAFRIGVNVGIPHGERRHHRGRWQY